LIVDLFNWISIDFVARDVEYGVGSYRALKGG